MPGLARLGYFPPHNGNIKMLSWQAQDRSFNPLDPPILGEVSKRMGDTTTPPAGCVLHLFLGVIGKEKYPYLGKEIRK